MQPVKDCLSLARAAFGGGLAEPLPLIRVGALGETATPARARNLIERMFCRLKDFRRIAT